MYISRTYSNLLLHVVFSTKRRCALIKLDVEPELYRYITGIVQKHNCALKQIGGTSNHIHMLLQISSSTYTPKLIGDIKAYSSKWIKRRFPFLSDFAWQSGYGAFTVSQSCYGKCLNYIANQKYHHRCLTVEEELHLICEANNVKFYKDEILG